VSVTLPPCIHRGMYEKETPMKILMVVSHIS